MAGFIVLAGVGARLVEAQASTSAAPVSTASDLCAPASFAEGWIVYSDGTVAAVGGAPWYRDLPAIGKHVSDIVGILPTPDCGGYWLVGTDGGIFGFGDAHYYGSLPALGITPPSPVVGAVACGTAAYAVYVSGDPQPYYGFDCEVFGAARHHRPKR